MNYHLSPVDIAGKAFTTVQLTGAGYGMPKGFPDLPSINKAIIIPDDRAMKAEVVSADYSDVPVEGIAPSRGTIYRDQDPSTVPYTFDALYRQDTWYPQEIVELDAPFIQRDFRGSLVRIHPFRYNPARKSLRVYSRITFRVVSTGSSDDNVLTRTRAITGLDAEFSAIYADRFLNFDPTRYPIVEEEGKLLIVSHADFTSAIAPLADWKKRKGFTVEVVDVAQAGTSASALQAYIKKYYETAGNKLKYVLLVGDADKVPTVIANAKGADIKYGQVAGTDIYADIFVGRFSGTTAAHIKAQVDKSLFYERNMKTTDTWLSNVLLSASSDKTKNKWGETDADFVNHEYDSLSKAGYTNVYRHNQNGVGGQGCVSGSASSCSGVINKGIAFWEYSDHGSKTSYPAVGFTVASANALGNADKYFYTYSVACNPGEFQSGSDCLGEAFMKKENAGAIGCYMGSISQPWDPPYAALREILRINLERTHKKSTLGGIMLNGGMCSYEACPNSEGKKTYECFVLFGDPSLQLYSKTPAAISIKHPDGIGTGTQSIAITGTDDAQVCLYSEKQGIHVAGVIKGGMLSLSIEVKSGDPIYVTGTKRNCETYEGTINGTTGIIAGNGGKDFKELGFSAAVRPGFSARNGIHFAVFAPDAGTASIAVYDIAGKMIFASKNTAAKQGAYTVVLDAKALHGGTIASGMYHAVLSFTGKCGTTVRKTTRVLFHR